MSKETVVLPQWASETVELGIKRVHKGFISTVKRYREIITLPSFYRRNVTSINLCRRNLSVSVELAELAVFCYLKLDKSNKILALRVREDQCTQGKTLQSREWHSQTTHV